MNDVSAEASCNDGKSMLAAITAHCTRPHRRRRRRRRRRVMVHCPPYLEDITLSLLLPLLLLLLLAYHRFCLWLVELLIVEA